MTKLMEKLKIDTITSKLAKAYWLVSLINNFIERYKDIIMATCTTYTKVDGDIVTVDLLDYLASNVDIVKATYNIEQQDNDGTLTDTLAKDIRKAYELARLIAKDLNIYYPSYYDVLDYNELTFYKDPFSVYVSIANKITTFYPEFVHLYEIILCADDLEDAEYLTKDSRYINCFSSIMWIYRNEFTLPHVMLYDRYIKDYYQQFTVLVNKFIKDKGRDAAFKLYSIYYDVAKDPIGAWVELFISELPYFHDMTQAIASCWLYDSYPDSKIILK